MRGKTGDIFTTIRTEGALLPAEILRRIVEGDRKLEGLDPESYHLEKSEKINEAVNRAWFRCLGAWRTFRAAAVKLADSDTGTTLTRERWLLILFQELGYGRLLDAKALEIGGNTYPISHVWHHTPIHLVSFRQDMDRRTPGVAGAARLSPHSLVQEFLNRSENHLWGVVSNGHRLRILRDNISLTRQTYVDFDLEALMDGEIYPDFVLLYLLLHQSRLEADKPEECRLEKWSREAQERGTRALDRLRDGVEQAITALGQGFLAHPENTALRRALQAGTLSPLGYYKQLLRLIYRFIFLFVAEDRGLIPLSDISADVRKRYTFYAIARLRRLAGRRRGTRHGDLYAGLRVTFACLEKGEPSLGIPALNGFLFSPETLPDLNGCKMANDALLSAIRGLCYTEENRLLRPVDYRNLGTEELGSVYESLLELHPELNAEAFTFALKTYAGSERKTTGSYYTHPSLIRCLLDSALEPLLDEAMKKPDPEEAILSLKFVDPACGSGHFLIAAAHRIAKRLAVVRTGEGEPPLEALREALRDVVANCIYGVDINPLAVELCKVALWLESLDPRKPLGFLDHRIKCGNSIIGATPELLAKGIPDDAFKTIEGDDPAVASSIRRKNKEERKGQQDLFLIQEDRSDWREAASAYATWASLPEDNIGQVSEKARQYDTLLGGRAIRHQHDLADLWTAAFFWPLTKATYDTVPTQDVFRRLRDGAYALDGKTAGRVKALAEEHRFFHWHLEFPEVFMKRKGFDCDLGNPPWERIKLQEKEFFAQRDPEIANAPNAAARKRLIANLPETNPDLWKAFASAKRMAEGESHFFRTSGRYPLSAVGDLNTYQIFAGLFRELLSDKGRAGVIVPTGIATDDTNKQFFADLTEKKALLSLYDFENREGIFPAVHRSYKFCLLTMGGPDAAPEGTDFAFFLTNTAQLHESDRHFKLSSEDIALLNPNTRTCPIFRSKRDAELTKKLYQTIGNVQKVGQTFSIGVFWNGR
ncbi:MAG: N-6 DNA methylase [Proteobacteria bacterium]|nr:N-6 DNA methylase [Pseudomonadota bacterium]